MTQDDLAQRLGITPQAVSKWENDLAYPDITIIPTLCAIFEVSLDDLFGKTKKDVSELSFPPTFKGVPVVATFANIACYSDKEPAETGGSTVTFKDGSIAELQQRRIVNKGAGQIYLKSIDDFAGGDLYVSSNAKDNEIISVSHEYGEVLSLECSLPCFNCDINSVEGEVSTLQAEGFAGFTELLEFDYDVGKKHLKIDYDQHKYQTKYNNIDTNRWDLSKNIIKIALACPADKLDSAIIKINSTGVVHLNIPAKDFSAGINGSGKILANGIPFDDAVTSINGSGEICCGDAGKLKTSINGSGVVNFNNAGELSSSINGSGVMNFNDVGTAKSSINGSGVFKANDIKDFDTSINGSGAIEIHECGSLKIGINGSGALEAEKVTKSVDISIRGNGDIGLKGGEIETFNVNINNNGEVRAGGVTTKRAEIKMPQQGKVEIGRVIEESVEICGDKAELIIHNRGI